MLFKGLLNIAVSITSCFPTAFLAFCLRENSVEKTVDSSDPANQTLENTLNDNSLGGQTGDINDYFMT